MALVDITEYRALAADGLGRFMPAGQEPALANQQVSNAGASTQSAAFNASAFFVSLHTDAACRIAFGTNPTATSASRRLAANTTEFFGVSPGMKVAVIASS